MKPVIAVLAASLTLSPMLASSAEARGLRIGIGFGIGLAAGLGAYGAGAVHSGRPRAESVVNGRYRCCSERHVVERHAPERSRPRVQREDEEKVEKKVIRKKPVKSEETAVASARARPAKPAQEKQEKVAKLPKVTQPTPVVLPPNLAAAAVPPPPEAVPATQDVAASLPAVGPFALVTAAEEPARADAKRLPRIQTVQQPVVPAEPELNCRKYVPTLGQTLAVSCME